MFRQLSLVSVALVCLRVPSYADPAVLRTTAPIAHTSSTAAAGNEAGAKDLIDQVLAGNWKKVYASTTAEHGGPGVSDPVDRFLAGHAALATNRDNEALMLFLSLQRPADQRAVLDWAQQVADAHPGSAIALYLAGDALARGGNLTAAESQFTASLKADPKLALAWLARGVVRSLLGGRDGADEQDIEHASELSPNLADACASLGCLAVRDETASEAERAFNKALDLDPHFALALNGRGCARYGSGVGTEEAALDFDQALDLCPLLACASTNRAFVDARIARMLQDHARVASNAPGTTISENVTPVGPPEGHAGPDYSLGARLAYLTAKLPPTEPTENLTRHDLLARAGSVENATMALNMRREYLVTDARSVCQAMGGDLTAIKWDNRLDMGLGASQLAYGAATTYLASKLTVKAPMVARALALARLSGVPGLAVQSAGVVLVALNTAADIHRATQYTVFDDRVTQARNDNLSCRIVALKLREIGPGPDPTRSPASATIFPNSLSIEHVSSLAHSVAEAVGGRQVVDVVGALNSPRVAAMESALDAYKVPHVWTPTASPGYAQVVALQDPDRIRPAAAPAFSPNWKVFTPASNQPGGVTNENLEWIFEDRGNWPVITFFTLAYRPPGPKPEEH